MGIYTYNWGPRLSRETIRNDRAGHQPPRFASRGWIARIGSIRPRALFVSLAASNPPSVRSTRREGVEAHRLFFFLFLFRFSWSRRRSSDNRFFSCRARETDIARIPNRIPSAVRATDALPTFVLYIYMHTICLCFFVSILLRRAGKSDVDSIWNFSCAMNEKKIKIDILFSIRKKTQCFAKIQNWYLRLKRIDKIFYIYNSLFLYKISD